MVTDKALEFFCRDGRTFQKDRELLDEVLSVLEQVLRLVQRFTFQQDNGPKHTAKTLREWLREVFECP
jgi:hypothetical protein